MSQRSELVPVAPEEGAVRLATGSIASGSGAASAGERLAGSINQGEETWLMAAVEMSGHDAAAERVAGDLRGELSSTTLDDAGAAMKQAFRRINTGLYQQGMGAQTASAVALLARGKYATIASTGDGRAYLMRAGRLNQVTRDITPTPLRGGKGKQTASDPPREGIPVRLGERERLDSRQPAIYELTLLPEDRLLLCTAAVARGIDERALVAQLTIGDIEQSLALLRTGDESGAAVVATVAAARVREPVVVGSDEKSSPLPIIAAFVLVALLIAAYIVYQTLL